MTAEVCEELTEARRENRRLRDENARYEEELERLKQIDRKSVV